MAVYTFCDFTRQKNEVFRRPFKRQPDKMVKHTQTEGLALKGLKLLQ